ncbi:RraA family protein [Fodinibius sediminis]|nr:RraA family protein [Fodinibius sediminis]
MKYVKSWSIFVFIFCLCFPFRVNAQTIPEEKLIALTPHWEGERFDDGRPRVPDHILERMEHVTIEEAWGIIRGEGYHNQFEGGQWRILHPEEPIVGRALTATYMPARPGVQEYIDGEGKKADRSGPPNTWPIDMLEQGDVYVADGYGKVKDGTLIGDRLGNTIYANSGNGVVFNGSSRDREGLAEIEGFNAFVRDWHPSFIQEMMLAAINGPTRIGSVTVLPGDVVLAKPEGVIFIPPHLAEQVVTRSEVIRARDAFAHERVRSGTYTAGQMDTEWTDAIEEDFRAWLQANSERLQSELGVSSRTIDNLLND